MANVSRPAQGDNSRPARKPRPAYKADAAPVVTSVGTLQNPKPNRWGKPTTRVADATPKVVQS